MLNQKTRKHAVNSSDLCQGISLPSYSILHKISVSLPSYPKNFSQINKINKCRGKRDNCESSPPFPMFLTFSCWLVVSQELRPSSSSVKDTKSWRWSEGSFARRRRQVPPVKNHIPVSQRDERGSLNNSATAWHTWLLKGIGDDTLVLCY